MKIYLQFSTLLLVTLWGANCQNSSSAGNGTAAPVTTQSVSDPAKADDNIWVASGLVTDLSLSDFPTAELEVKYAEAEVRLNETLTPAQASAGPTVLLKGAVNCTPPFALIMVDPDAPTRNNATLRSVLHWLVLNVNSTERMHEGEEAVSYRGPRPPVGSGYHRYVFLAYCQGDKRLETMELAPAERYHFQLAEFVEKAKLGRPFAGTFFFAQNV